MIDDAALAAIDKPAGWDLAMWFDLSPMRPDAFDRQDAERWCELVELRNAATEGAREAQEEHRREGPKLAAMAQQQQQADAALTAFLARAMNPGRVG